MSTVKKCDRHNKIINDGGSVYTVELRIINQDGENEQDDLVRLEDCCQQCRDIIVNAMTPKSNQHKKKKKKKKKKIIRSAKPRSKQQPTATVAPSSPPKGTQVTLPTPAKPPPKPSVPPPPA